MPCICTVCQGYQRSRIQVVNGNCGVIVFQILQPKNKKIEIIILAFCQLLFSYIFAFLISSLFNGFGSVSREFLNSLSEIFIQNFVYVLACVSVTIFILYLTHSMTFAYLGFISLLILQAGVILLFPLLNMNLFSYGVILICLWGGYQAFQHRDL